MKNKKLNTLKGFLLSTWKNEGWKKVNKELDWLDFWKDKYVLSNEMKVRCLEEYIVISGLDNNEYYLEHCEGWQDELLDNKKLNPIMEQWIKKVNE